MEKVRIIRGPRKTTLSKAVMRKIVDEMIAEMPPLKVTRKERNEFKKRVRGKFLKAGYTKKEAIKLTSGDGW